MFDLLMLQNIFPSPTAVREVCSGENGGRCVAEQKADSAASSYVPALFLQQVSRPQPFLLTPCK